MSTINFHQPTDQLHSFNQEQLNTEMQVVVDEIIRLYNGGKVSTYTKSGKSLAGHVFANLKLSKKERNDP